MHIVYAASVKFLEQRALRVRHFKNEVAARAAPTIVVYSVVEWRTFEARWM
jgi:hypothetical protein